MTKRFLLDLLERAVRTFAQVMLANLGAQSVSITHMSWSTALQVAAGAAVISVLMSVAAARFGSSDSASALPAALSQKPTT